MNAMLMLDGLIDLLQCYTYIFIYLAYGKKEIEIWLEKVTSINRSLHILVIVLGKLLKYFLDKPLYLKLELFTHLVSSLFRKD